VISDVGTYPHPGLLPLSMCLLKSTCNFSGKGVSRALRYAASWARASVGPGRCARASFAKV
jgi:hypothetical protein